MSLYAYIPHPDFSSELKNELHSTNLVFKTDFLYLSKKKIMSLWTQQFWNDCELLDIESIQDAQKKLKSYHCHWIPYAFQLHRRTQLISEKIPLFKKQKISLNQTHSELYQNKKIGSFCLVDKNKLLISTNIFPVGHNGLIEFNEDKNAPSRAYLKLWETFFLIGKRPKPNEKVIDLGSSPGGWTYVLSNLGCHVRSVDKAPVDTKLLGLSNVEYLKKDAFQLNPHEVGHQDWLFSDIICEPQKLYELITKWRESGLVHNFVCTIKFKGSVDQQTLKKFKEIPQSRILHLSCNKHELTWIQLKS